MRCGSTQMHPSCHGSASGWRLGPPGGSLHQSRASGLWRAPASRGGGLKSTRTHTQTHQLDTSLHGLKSGRGKTLHVWIRGSKSKCGDRGRDGARGTGDGGRALYSFPSFVPHFLPMSRPLPPSEPQQSAGWIPSPGLGSNVCADLVFRVTSFATAPLVAALSQPLLF